MKYMAEENKMIVMLFSVCIATVVLGVFLLKRWLCRTIPLSMDFVSPPSLIPLYIRMILHAFLKRGADIPNTMPALVATYPDMTVDMEHLAEYIRATHNNDTTPDSKTTLPLYYMQCIAGPLMMQLLAHPEFPFSIMGAVHASNMIRANRPLQADERFTIQVAVLPEVRPVKRGVEFDVEISVYSGENNLLRENALTSTATMLVFAKKNTNIIESTTKVTKKPIEDDVNKWDSTNNDLIRRHDFTVPLGIGRRFASLCSDYNPIHVSDWTSKCFGFPRAIAHGMWMTGQCFAALEAEKDVCLPEFPLISTVRFRRPCYIPCSYDMTMFVTPKSRSLECRVHRHDDVETYYQVFSLQPLD